MVRISLQLRRLLGCGANRIVVLCPAIVARTAAQAPSLLSSQSFPQLFLGVALVPCRGRQVEAAESEAGARVRHRGGGCGGKALCYNPRQHGQGGGGAMIQDPILLNDWHAVLPLAQLEAPTT